MATKKKATEEEPKNVELDMTIFNNPDRGKGYLPFLDEIEAQATENANAQAEGRLPRRVLPRERHGKYADSVDNGPIEFDEYDDPNFEETNQNDYFQNRENERTEAVIPNAEERKELIAQLAEQVSSDISVTVDEFATPEETEVTND